MRRLAFEPEPEPVLPDLASAIEAVLDDRRSVDDVPGLLAKAADLAVAAGSRAVVFEAEPAPDRFDEAVRDAGYELVRTMLQLRRPLPLPAALHRPASLALRPFRPGTDESAWLEVNRRAFAWHPEQGRWTEADLLEREAEPWFRRDGFLVLDADDADEDGDGIAGFCWTKIHADHDPPLGEIYVIGVDPDRHGRGLGRALVQAGLDWLAGEGMKVAMLYVEADNAAARHLYRELGFVEHAAHRWWRRDL